METKKLSVRAISRERELDVLRMIGRCGYLTTRLIALSVWHLSSEHVARNKAQLMLLRLEKKGLVLKKAVAAQSMEHVWILTQRGADDINAQSDERAWARSGHDLGFTRLQQDKLVLGRGIEKIRASQNETLLLGRAGIRAVMPSEHHDFDAIFFDLPENSNPIYTGLIAVVDARPSLVERIVRVKKIGVSIEYVGDEQIISMLLKRVEQAMR